ncbi:hypothetical protein BDV93DRAFT_353907 [Ceratobasidium sp. AG-I]|nr:hypothetical protein BDV93DRAFT_353907 [Ceratobasidium sp. AG-I]
MGCAARSFKSSFFRFRHPALHTTVCAASTRSRWRRSCSISRICAFSATLFASLASSSASFLLIATNSSLVTRRASVLVILLGHELCMSSSSFLPHDRLG